MQTILPTTPLTRWLTGYRSQTQRPGPRQTCELTRRQVLSVSFPVCGKITCASGSLWITRDGDPEDIVLRGGETLACDPGTRFMIEALESASMEVAGSFTD